MKEIEMKDVMDALNTVYTEVELSHRDVVNIAAAVMPLFESVFIDYKLLEALKDQLMEHLSEIQEQSEMRVEQLVSQMRIKENINEELKQQEKVAS